MYMHCHKYKADLSMGPCYLHACVRLVLTSDSHSCLSNPLAIRSWVQHVPNTSPMKYRELVNGPHGSIGPEAQSTWLKATPWAFRKMLNWINDR